MFDKSGELKSDDVQFTLSVTGSHSQLTLTHIPTGAVVSGDTYSSRHRLQKRLLSELKHKVTHGEETT
jgi:protein subunit release factor A